jgi:methyltransferase (TIGR00027 family)
MQEGKPSLMAEWAALVRALHGALDERPLVFEDPLAGRLLGPEFRARFEREREAFRAEGMLLIRSMMMMRSRFAEEQLDRAFAAGVRQYVILGAGLDSFAYRQPPALAGVVIYEVDHPDTQRWKRERLVAAGLEVPVNLRFVPVDFNRQAFATAMTTAGFDASAPAFFTWLGVSYYLPESSFLATLRFIATLPAPSAVVFDFALRDAVLPAHLAPINHEVFAYMAEAGEPWQLHFEPQALQARLRALGFDALEYLSPAAADRRYLSGRRDGLRAGPLVGLMYAARR